MVPHGEEGHVERHVPHCWVGLKDGDDSDLDKHEEDGVLPGAGQGKQREREVSQGPTLETPDSIL